MPNRGELKQAIEASIVDDIESNARGFLPGGRNRPSKDQIVRNMARSIRIDGLGLEEAYLALSCFPASPDAVYLSPLDKGLSGSKVFRALYEVSGGHRSRPYVMKIGPCQKIEAEHDAIRTLVQPFIDGVEEPIFRRGTDQAIVVQGFAGMQTRIESLRDFARRDAAAHSVVSELLTQRLKPWYQNKGERRRRVPLGKLLEWHLAKRRRGAILPRHWAELANWVASSSGHSWASVAPALRNARSTRIDFFESIAHGDLHSQNILIDERRQCWPIDFYWCRGDSTPLVDCALLETSLKFLAVPPAADLRTLLAIDLSFCREPMPNSDVGRIPFRVEIKNVLNCVRSVREFAFDSLSISFDTYRKALLLMAYAHTTHPQLNQPFLLGSLQMLSGELTQ